MELKAVKSKNEITHIQKAMHKDGIALIRAFRWLESEIENEHTVSEFDFAEKCAFYRSQQTDYKGESFNAIVGYKGNGAIIHYHPTIEKAATIKKGGLLLVDSGGQYLDGTTDITRTIFIGNNPPLQIKKHFTLVLKGFIALASAQFPSGTVGMQLDTLARTPLWKQGLNYAHGTGHGVGFFLSVHEGPQGFATNPTTSRGTTPLKPGMITTNEPGVYLEGEYGIRIENVLLCKDLENGFLAFEDLTLFPISLQLIDSSLLNQDEKEWLNNYHRLVWNGLSPLISDAEKNWLQQQCSPI
jgi:Xaa-Pro aminopeptidase